MLKFVSLSVGSGELWKSLEHDRNMIRFEFIGNQLGHICKMNLCTQSVPKGLGVHKKRQGKGRFKRH